MQLCMYALVQKGAFEGTFPFQKNMQLFKKSELLLKPHRVKYFFSINCGNSIMKQYITLVQILFARSKLKLDFQNETFCIRADSQVTEQLKNLGCQETRMQQ